MSSAAGRSSSCRAPCDQPALGPPLQWLPAATTTPRSPLALLLIGVRFGAFSAAGPSGARPEHLRDAIGSRPRAVATQLGRAIALLHDTAMQGHLSDHSRWLLDSKLVYLRKKTGAAPRPIRAGELWRRVVAKKAAHGVREQVRALFLRSRQFGIAIPGGADAMVHFRTAVEEALRADAGPALALLDLDLQNAFPRFEWDAIRRGATELVPEIADWTSLCHGSPANVLLPSGEWIQSGRQRSRAGRSIGVLVLWHCLDQGFGKGP